jgi:hypothetical protein
MIGNGIQRIAGTAALVRVRGLLRGLTCDSGEHFPYAIVISGRLDEHAAVGRRDHAYPIPGRQRVDELDSGAGGLLRHVRPNRIVLEDDQNRPPDIV